jgi:Short C-terminal domain
VGLLRGTLHIATYGAVSAKSKKQRTASMQLAAMQGKSPTAIKAAGGRSFDAVNDANFRAKQLSGQRRAAGRATPQPPGLQTEFREQASGADLISEMERLVALHDSGAIDDEEFRAAKARILYGR